MTMSGLNNSLYVEQMLDETRPHARVIDPSRARVAFSDADRRVCAHSRLRRALAELPSSTYPIVIAVAVVLAVIFST